MSFGFKGLVAEAVKTREGRKLALLQYLEYGLRKRVIQGKGWDIHVNTMALVQP